MKRILFLCALVVGLLGGQSAHADTYSLSFSGCFGVVFFGCTGTAVSNGTSSPGVTDITFTTNGTPGLFNPVDVTSISGTVDIGGDTYTIGNLATGLGGDNMLNEGLLGSLYFDNNGLDFLLTGSGSPDYTELDLTWDTVTGAYTVTTEQCHRNTCTPETYSGTDWGLAISDIDPAATPEPGSLALLGTSILGGAGLLRRRFHA